MNDPFEKMLRHLDAPRPIDPQFGERLLDSLIHCYEASPSRNDGDDLWIMQRVDAPRELPLGLRQRLEVALARRAPRSRLILTTSVAASIAVLLIASTVVLIDARRQARLPVAIQPLPSPISSPSPPVPPPPEPPGSLRAFSSAHDFLAYVKNEALKLVTPNGIRSLNISTRTQGGPVDGMTFRQDMAPAFMAQSAASSAPSAQFSTTNIQEEGVDEPDLVKTDGGRMAILTPTRVWLVDVSRNPPRVEGFLDVSRGTGLMMVGDRLIHLSSSFEGYVHGSTQATQDERASQPMPTRPWTKLTVIDISRPARPKIVSSIKVEGSYVAARESGGVIRLVIQSGALGPEPARAYNSSEETVRAAEELNKRAVRRSVVGHWLPHYVMERPGQKAETGHVHDWDRISKPPERVGVSMLTVMTVDPANPRPDDAVSVIGSGDIVYASLNNLYVTTSRLDDLIDLEAGRLPKDQMTRIHKFDITDSGIARYVAGGEVAGYLLNQFSMSEHEGNLRVATTVGSPWRGQDQPPSESFVTVLAEDAGRLIPIGSIGNLGQEERIYSVRFIGTMGYVVTFRQTDPLYTIDLSDPHHPEMKGELKIPGFSSYLHPIGATMLLGIGRAADEAGRPMGVQFSLFDVSDPANPRRLHERVEGQGGHSEVANDHHAFLYWAATGLLSVPVTIYESDEQPQDFVGALLMTVDAANGFAEPTRVSHFGREDSSPDSYHYPQIRRSVVVGDRLLTVSYAGLLVSDSKSFRERAWVPLRL